MNPRPPTPDVFATTWFQEPPQRPVGGGTVFLRPPAPPMISPINFFRRIPTGGTVFQRIEGNAMPTPEEMQEEITRLTQVVQDLLTMREEDQSRWAEERAALEARITPQEQLDRLTAERNTAQMQLSDLDQEHQRLLSVLQETVSGVQSWVPDLTPVPDPPSTLDPSLREAWVRDQIAARRATWDQFVHRVVTQASV